MEKIFLIRIEALFPMLIWGNAIALLFLCIYRHKNTFTSEQKILDFLIFARICHTIHYFVASGRGIFPDLVSVNFGMIVLFIGFYYEALAILHLINEHNRFRNKILLIITLGCVLIFNITEYFLPMGGIRITMASLGVCAIMIFPTLRMLRNKNSKIFIKSVGIFYAIFLLLMFIRSGYGAYNTNISVLSTNIISSVAFLALMLQLIIALPSYMIVLKDYADEALLLMATTDKLTGATNRHAFLDAAVTMYNNCRFFRKPLSILFIDIDHFKEVNDSYGHVFGDLVLMRLAAIIDSCRRDSDLSCRYGGEEFVVMLPRSDCGAADLVARRILNEVRAASFEEHPEFNFTVSIGIFCGVPLSDEQNFEAFIHAADEAMYQAKRSGRDQVVLREVGQ